MAVYPGIVCADAPEVTDIPDQVIEEGDSFDKIKLNKYLDDDGEGKVTWSFTGNVELSVSISKKNDAKITTPHRRWTGTETIIFTATDKNGESDSNAARFTVNDKNDPPVVGNISDQTIAEGAGFASFDLDNFVADDQDTDSEIAWTSSGNNELVVVIDRTSHVVKVTALGPDCNGPETMTFTATDTGGLADRDSARFRVTTVNDPPVIGSIFDQTIAEGAGFVSFDLDNFVADDQDTDRDIVWTYSGNRELVVAIDRTSHVVKVTAPGPDWNGSETITFTATDTGGLSDRDSARFRVTAVNNPPVITSDPRTEADSNTLYTYLPSARDPENDVLTWSLDSKPPNMTVDPVTGAIAWTPTAGMITSEELKLKVSDGNKGVDTQTFTITVINSPSVATILVTGIGKTSATVNGEIIFPGNPTLSQHGICWNGAGDPRIGDNPTELGAVGTPGTFVSEMSDLIPDTRYYVRAYATNTVGTVYGEEQTFVTAGLSLSSRAVVFPAPAPLNRATIYRMQVTGAGVISYRYRLNNGPWSSEQSIESWIEFDVFDEVEHVLEVVGKNASETWQSEQEATVVSWIIDTTPPVAVLSNHPRGVIGPARADIFVSGMDVAAFRYALDDGELSAASPVSKPIVLPELVDGPHTLKVVGADRVSNWQVEENATVIAWTVDSGIPTAVLTNLPARITREVSIDIGITSVGGTIPVERYIYTFDKGRIWFHGDMDSTIEIAGLSEGEHTLCVNAFGNNTWQDGSEDGLSSTTSATCHHWRVDLTPAKPVVLTVENKKPGYPDEHMLAGSKAVQLTWSWSSAQASEAILYYRVFYSTSPITEKDLGNAVEVFCDIIPGGAGFKEKIIVNGLSPGKMYYFTVTSVDMAGNESILSNVPSIYTDSTVPEVYLVTLEHGSRSFENSQANKLLIEGRNFLETTGSNIILLEDKRTIIDIPSDRGTGQLTSGDIPHGVPAGTYRARVVNAHGMSLSTEDRIDIIEAALPLPIVRTVTPSVVPTGARTALTIVGNYFNDTLQGVNIIDSRGVATALVDIAWVNSTTITAVVDITGDFAEGRYQIQVVNTENEFNEFSTARLEIFRLLDLDAFSEAISTSGIVRLKEGLVPSFITLNSDASNLAGGTSEKITRIKVMLEPGTMFEVENIEGWVPYEDIILPPRAVAPEPYMSKGIGPDVVPFSMGSSKKLRLNNGVVFVSLDATLPARINHPVLYQVETDGELKPAGVNGTWRGQDIHVGGTILATRYNVPETGLTTFTMGVLLDHMSEFVVGPLSSDARYSELLPLTADEYGPCFIGTLTSPRP